MNMRPSIKAYDLIKCFEGFRPKAYYCPGMKLTVGYGTTRGVRAGMVVSHEQALELLKRDVMVFAEAINRLVKVPLNQNQFDALVSFVYNIGEGAFQKSTMLKLLNARKYEEASAQFERWKFTSNWIIREGVKLLQKIAKPGLVNRRAAERALFDKPIHEC